MDKKIGVSILLGVLVLICVVGVTKGVVNSANSADMLGNASIVLYDDGYGYDNATKGGTSEIVNLTVAYGLTSSANNESNITNITVSWDSGNMTFLGWMYDNDAYGGDCIDEEGTGCGNDPGLNGTFYNVTINADGSVGDWNCTNLSTSIINCQNNTADSVLDNDNNTLTMRFNVTAAASIEDKNEWNITVEDNSKSINTLNSTTVETYVDGLAPRLVELNISDGNITYNNGSFSGINTSQGYYTYVDSNADLTVTATYYELSPSLDSYVQLYYNGTNSSQAEIIVNGNLYTNLEPKNATILSPASNCVVGTLSSNGVASAWTHPIKCSWTIPSSALNETESNATIFGFVVNDTFNNIGTWNDTSSIGSASTVFSILTNNTLPHVSVINISDEFGNILDGTSGKELSGVRYLGGDTTIRFEVTGAPRNVNESDLNGSISLYYNVTGSSGGLSINPGPADAQGLLGGVVERYDDDGVIDVTNGNYNITIDENDANLLNPVYTSLFSVRLGAGENATGNKVEFAIVIGNTSLDNQNGNYTRTMGPYSYIIDAAPPGGVGATGITIERVSESSGITQNDATGVEYKCSATDSESGIWKYVWTLDKPGDGNDLITTHDSLAITTSDTITYKNTDINELGDYNVKCVVYDIVGNYDANGKTTSSSEGFTVSAVSNVAAGAGAGGAAAVITFDVDFTTANEGTLKAQQGRVKSFSFDGVTKHTITFMEVTGTSATLKIESTPVTITLNVKETKDVDVNGDGANDMSVVLNSIVNGVADITVKKVEEGAAKIVKEEEAARGIKEEVTTPVTPVEKKGMTWLWVLIAIIVIAALGYYFFNKKK